jgi:hypothetical protein
MTASTTDESLRETLQAAPAETRRLLQQRSPRALDGIAWLASHLVAIDRTIYRRASHLDGAAQSLVEEQRRLSHELERLLRVLERHATGDMLMAGMDVVAIRQQILRLVDEHEGRLRSLIELLRTQLSVAEQRSLAADYIEVLQHAPTRPHPAAPHHGLLGALAVRVDAVRDRIRELLDAHEVPMHAQPVQRPTTRWARYLAGSTDFTDTERRGSLR